MTGSDIAALAVSLRDVRFSWPGGGFSLTVPSFDIAAGESVLLLGQSGSGKSTLLSLISGINVPQSGDVHVHGIELSKLSARRRDRFRADTVGLVFQMFNLLPYASALDNVRVPLRFSPKRRARCTDAKTEALRLTRALGLPDHSVTRGAAANLSVGQQQRVAVARAMIGAPPILIADEPTSALDADTQDDFLDLVFKQTKAHDTTLLMVSHDQTLASRFDRCVHLTDIAQMTQAEVA